MDEAGQRARSLRTLEHRVMDVLSVWGLKASGMMTAAVVERKSGNLQCRRWSGQEASRELQPVGASKA